MFDLYTRDAVVAQRSTKVLAGVSAPDKAKYAKMIPGLGSPAATTDPVSN